MSDNTLRSKRSSRVPPAARLAASFLVTLFSVVLSSSCSRSDTVESSETHFLSQCTSDEQCPEALSCVCGACSRTCETTSDCSEFDARCLVPTGGCGIEMSCDIECESDGQCDQGSCAGGRCRRAGNSGIGRLQAGGADVAADVDDSGDEVASGGNGSEDAATNPPDAAIDSEDADSNSASGPAETTAPTEDAPSTPTEQSEGAECSTRDDCVLAPPKCCDDCNSQPWEATSVVDYMSFQDEQCAGLDCVPSSPVEPGELACPPGHHELVAACEEGQCRTLDLLESDYTSCESAADCELQIGTNCCPGCSYQTTRSDGDEYYAGGIVAFSDHDEFLSDMCADIPFSCDPCGPRAIADQITAACIDGHCTVQYDGSPLTFSDDDAIPNPPEAPSPP